MKIGDKNMKKDNNVIEAIGDKEVPEHFKSLIENKRFEYKGKNLKGTVIAETHVKWIFNNMTSWEMQSLHNDEYKEIISILEKFFYYEADSPDVILIKNKDDKVNERCVKVRGMKKQSDEVIALLRKDPDRRWSINEIKKIEGW